MGIPDQPKIWTYGFMQIRLIFYIPFQMQNDSLKTIFIVDDNAVNLMTAKQALESDYRVLTLPSAARMFEVFAKVVPDLILLDIEMPEMDGFAALEKLAANKRTAKIPVMFLTASTDAKVEARGLELGAVDFVSKPFSPPVLQNRIAHHLNINEIVKKRTEQVEKLQNGIIFTLANILESRDKITGRHIKRTSQYLKILLDAMLERGLYFEEMIEWDFDMTVAAACLHDVGKIVVSDLILNNPGKLTPEEFDEIRRHTLEGELIIDQMIEQIGDNVSFLQQAKLFAGNHHEHWDGTGYPRGLKGEKIPLQGRIMAIADVYDALVSERPYKPAFPREQAEEIIQNDSGTFFDPKIVEVFMMASDKFAAVADNN
jgi:putative two-component system response regulator